MNPSEIDTDHASTALESEMLLSWAEELLPMEALHCYFKLEKPLLCNLLFLRLFEGSYSRKLMLVFVCSVFWKNSYVEPEMSTGFGDCR